MLCTFFLTEADENGGAERGGVLLSSNGAVSSIAPHAVLLVDSSAAVPFVSIRGIFQPLACHMEPSITPITTSHSAVIIAGLLAFVE